MVIKSKNKKYRLLLCVILFAFAIGYSGCKDSPFTNSHNEPEHLTITLEPATQFQTIHNFGASDAWSCQFVGKNWPLEKRNQIADLLFSKELNSDGSLKGIGLSSWRFNIGGGSAEQGANSNIMDEWRRAESFLESNLLFNQDKQKGQRWFLTAAKERGVTTFTGFVNSPPVALTKNGKAYSSGGNSANLPPEKYNIYSDFLIETITFLKENEGVELDYISPFNEPQWDWSDAGQEGSPWLNQEIYDFTTVLNNQLETTNLNTLIELPEAAQLDFLYASPSRHKRANQIDNFFQSNSPLFLGAHNKVAKKIAGHSYYTTWDLNNLIQTRNSLYQKYSIISPEIEFWMSEYTLLENNQEVNGNGRNLGMTPALYMARVIHADLTVANASAWQWWLGISPYDYKDGLVYIDWNKNDGNVYESKMLWALGNYSRFIEPGMKRIETKRSDNQIIEKNISEVMVSSFINPQSNKTVTVVLNYSSNPFPISIQLGANSIHATVYQTSDQDNLKNIGTTKFEEAFSLSPRSITTFVEE